MSCECLLMLTVQGDDKWFNLEKTILMPCWLTEGMMLYCPAAGDLVVSRTELQLDSKVLWVFIKDRLSVPEGELNETVSRFINSGWVIESTDYESDPAE